MDHHVNVELLNLSQEQKNMGLIDAAKSNDIISVKHFIEEGANLNAVNKYLYIALHWAAHNGNNQITELLLQNGANINQQNRRGNTPLHLAAFKGQTETVALLLKHDANVNQQNKKGETPLFLAVEHRHLQTTVCLLQNDANVNLPAENDCTPLHEAADHQDQELTLLLLQAGANQYFKNVEGETPLSFAFWLDKPVEGNFLFCFLPFMSDKEIEKNTREIHGFKKGLTDFKKQLLVCQQKLNNLFINFSAAQIPESIEDEIAKTFPVWYGPHIQKHLKELKDLKVLKELFVDPNSEFEFDFNSITFDTSGKHYTPSFSKPIQIDDKDIDINIDIENFNKISLNDSFLKNK